MIKGAIFAILSIALLASASYLLYENIPGERITLSISQMKQAEPNITYGETPLFMENLRFNHTNISYKLENSCSENQISSMKEAFEIFATQTGVISFYEDSSSEILVKCTEDQILLSEDLYVAGEGGPSEVVNTGLFNVINKGEILLYEEEVCDYPIIEIHELLHVFGFNHSDNPDSAMFNTSNCDQRMTEDMIQTIRKLYSIEALPELSILNLSATKAGKYLNFNITVKNQGLSPAKNVTLNILSEGEPKQFELGDLGVGDGKSLKVENLKLSSRNEERITFNVTSSTQELNPENIVVAELQ